MFLYNFPSLIVLITAVLWNTIDLQGLSKKRSGIQTFFSTTPYAALPYFRTLLWKAV